MSAGRNLTAALKQQQALAGEARQKHAAAMRRAVSDVLDGTCTVKDAAMARGLDKDALAAAVKKARGA